VREQGRQQRIADNETTFRRVNEAREPGAGPAAYVCECGRLGCTELVELSHGQYEAVRTSFERFLLVPGHEEPDADEVVEDHGHYLVVVKIGEAREALSDKDESGGEEVAGR
jgi:hypothetical protein